MKLLEYQAAELFKKYGISVPKGVVIDDASTAVSAMGSVCLSFPAVLKAQVAAGGRGKAGGVLFVDSLIEAKNIINNMLFSNLLGFKVNKILAVEKVKTEKEWYLSIMIDRTTGVPCVLFSSKGGIEIEETAKNDPDAIINIPINPLIGPGRYISDYICSKSEIGMVYSECMYDLIDRLYRLFSDNHCLLAEINPVVVCPGDKLTAVDGKIDIDDSALFRLPEIEAFRNQIDEPEQVTAARELGLLYIPLKKDARVGLISNGSGMLMNMMDMLSDEGIETACALDMGGGATCDRYCEAVRLIFSTPGVDILFIYIFGGITRCDEVAEGVKNALAGEIKNVIIRMEGTNKSEGMEITKHTPGVLQAGGITEGVKLVADKSREVQR